MAEAMKRKRGFVTAVSISYLLMIAFVGVSLYFRGISDIKPTYLFNITADMVGLLMGYVIFICCLVDVQKTGSDHRTFLYLLNTIELGLLSDAIAWLVDGVPSLIWLNVLDNTVYFIVPVAACFLFYNYLLSILKIKETAGVWRIVDKLVRAGLVISIALRLLNIPFGFYFTVDEAGIYSRAEYQPVSTIYQMFVLLVSLSIIIRWREQLKGYRMIAMLIYILTPIFISVFNIFVYGFSITYAVLMNIMLVMYCVINIDQGRQKAVSDRDLSTATSIQESVLPQIFPAFPDREDVDIYATMCPAREVGGDFYDFFFIDDDHLALVMADVSGKGVPAALFMMISNVLIKNRLRSGDSPAEALANVNNQIMERNVAKMFVTVWLAVIDMTTGRGIAANAGHEHPVLKRTGGEYELVEYKHSPAVGMVPKIKFKEHEFELSPGDKLFVYTDGVAEATDISGQLYGTDRLLEALNSDKDSNPKEAIERVRKSIDEFVGSATQSDDITMLGITYYGKKEEK